MLKFKFISPLFLLLLVSCGGNDYNFSSNQDGTEFSSHGAYYNYRVVFYRSLNEGDMTPVSVHSKGDINYVRIYTRNLFLRGEEPSLLKVATCGCPGEREEVIFSKGNGRFYEASFTKPLNESKDYQFIFTIGDETHVLDFK